MKKRIGTFFIGSILFLLACWGIGRWLHPKANPVQGLALTQAPAPTATEAVPEPPAAEAPSASEASAPAPQPERQAERAISFENAKETADNPWGVTAGMIETDSDGRCLFLTPNTAAGFGDLTEEERKKGIQLACEIHPWVATLSDGAGILVWYLNGDDILREETWAVSSTDAWQSHALTFPEGCTAVKFLCNNGGRDNDAADWVIMKMEP